MTHNNLPPNWSWVKLGDVCYTTSGGTPSRGNISYYNGTIPWVKSGELDKGLILDTEEKISDEALKNSSAKLFPKGTLLIALYGATIGKLAFLGVEAATNQAVCGIYKNENIDSNFLFNFLFFKKQYLVKQSIGGAQPNISQGILKNLEIPLPPLPEQKKIVEKIEELFSGLDSGVASLKKAKAQIRLYRQSVLSAAFSGRLHQDSSDYKINRIKSKQKSGKSSNPENHGSDNLPEGWKWVKLGEIISPSKDRFEPLQNDNVKYIGLEHIEKGTGVILSYADSNTVRSTKSVFKKGNLLYGKLRPYLNKIAIAEFDGVCSTDILVFKNQEKLSNKFLKYRLLCEDYVNYAQKNMKGVQHPRINFMSISEFEISLPQHTVQTQIVEEIEKRFSEADNLEKAIDESLTKSETLRQSILKQAFEGKLI